MSKVYIVLGSKSDWDKHVRDSKLTLTLRALEIAYEIWIISAHRNPDDLVHQVRMKMTRHEPVVFIAIAGMAAALPGAIAGASQGTCPVIGVALPSAEFPDATDAMLSMCRMPPGIPVMFAGIGKAGLQNAAFAAAQIMSGGNQLLHHRFCEYMAANTKKPIVPFEPEAESPAQKESEVATA